MVEHERERDDLAHGQLSVDGPWPVDDPADAEHRDLGVVDDRGRPVDPEPAVVVEGEGSAGQGGRRVVALTGVGNQVGDGVAQLGRRHPLGAVDDGDHQAARRLGREAEADGRVLHDLAAAAIDSLHHRGVQDRVLAEPDHGEPRDQGGEAVALVGGLLQPLLGGEQLGRVDVEPDRGFGDGRARVAEARADQFAHARDRDALIGGV